MYDRALKAIRQFHRLSQTELADQIDISKSYLSEIENSKKEPSLEILKKYSERFNLPLSSIMFFAENSGNESKTTKLDSGRIFIADKMLRILEWIAEDDDNENADSSKKKKKSSH